MRLVAALTLAVLLAPAAAMASYYVYCDGNRIAVESRSPEQMRIARGSGFCRMGPKFDYLSSAQDFARNNFGGEGRSCSCR